MYEVTRQYFKYGNEEDEICCTFKSFDTYKKALNYAQRYATGIKFCNVSIEFEGKEIYYQNYEGLIEINGKEIK